MEKIELIDEFLNLLQECFGLEIPEKVKNLILLIVATIVLTTFVVYIIIKFFKWIVSLRHRPWRKRKIKDILIPDYGDQMAEQKYFISSKFTTSPPNNLDDPLEVERVESARKLIDHLVEKVFVEENTTNRYFCILAGAGMGKTTFAVNLVISYINRYKKNTLPFEIKLVSLARRDFAEVLQQVDAPKETILILDALDENADASNDLFCFMQTMERLIQDFRFVILTSRTQFFPTEEDEPEMTSILNFGKEKGYHKYYKMYISPFSHDDVQTYLRKKYRKRRQRKKAEKIVAQCSSLATRPLLLSHLDDLLSNNRAYDTLSSIYKTLIDVWIKREVRFNKGGDDPELYQRLSDFSLDFALELFNNRDQSTNMRMSREIYLDFINRKKYIDYNFSGRSLINRDAFGTMKFSHKTFYEYFLAKVKIQNPDLEIPTKGYELAWEFYREMVREKVSKQSIFTLNEDDCSLLVKSKRADDFDFRLLNDVYMIKRVGCFSELLDNGSNLSHWLSQSSVECIDLVNYLNEPLNILLTMNNLKRLTIHKQSANKSKNYRGCIQKLRDRGVDVRVYTINRGANFYLGKIGVRYPHVLDVNVSYRDFVKRMQDYYTLLNVKIE